MDNDQSVIQRIIANMLKRMPSVQLHLFEHTKLVYYMMTLNNGIIRYDYG